MIHVDVSARVTMRCRPSFVMTDTIPVYCDYHIKHTTFLIHSLSEYCSSAEPVSAIALDFSLRTKSNTGVTPRGCTNNGNIMNMAYMHMIITAICIVCAQTVAGPCWILGMPLTSPIGPHPRDGPHPFVRAHPSWDCPVEMELAIGIPNDSLHHNLVGSYPRPPWHCSY